MTDFKDLNLTPLVSKALERAGYKTPTPIQAQAIPAVMDGKDVLGLARTGTGKTAAFVLPLLSKLVESEKPAPKRSAYVLIMAPTRELAIQIAESARQYARYAEDITVTAIFGGVSINNQIKSIVTGSHFLVATPGRLVDLLQRKAIKLGKVRHVVLDEADQMLDMGFIPDLRKILSHVPSDTRQTLLFSATLAPNIEKLSKDYMRDPVKISVAPQNSTAKKAEQRLIKVAHKDKASILGLKVLEEEKNNGQTLVFARTKRGADGVARKLLKMGIKAQAIHGDKSQGQRQRALQAFRSGELRVLVATDIAARGIDIDGVSLVINYALPDQPEQYVHRIGRTARAGREGLAISLYDEADKDKLKAVEKLIGNPIPREALPKDFNKLAAELRERKAIVIKKPDAQQPRKGRGKSCKKKNRQNQEAGNKTQNGHKPQQKSSGKKQGSSQKPSRAERRRVSAKGSTNKAEAALKSQDNSKSGAANAVGAKLKRRPRKTTKAPTRK